MRTLRALNKDWIFWLDRMGAYALPVGVLASVFLHTTETLDIRYGIVFFLVASLCMAIAHHICLYRLVVCPKCGWNLAKFKNGEKIPPKHVYNAFKAGRACLKCGWKPGAEA